MATKYQWEIDYEPTSEPTGWFLFIAQSNAAYHPAPIMHFFSTKEEAVAWRDEYFQYLNDLRAYEAETNFRGEVTI